MDWWKYRVFDWNEWRSDRLNVFHKKVMVRVTLIHLSIKDLNLTESHIKSQTLSQQKPSEVRKGPLMFLLSVEWVNTAGKIGARCRAELALICTVTQYAESSATRITALKIKGPHLCSGPRPSSLSSLFSTAGWTVERANATLHRRGIASSLHCSVWKHGLVKSSSGHYGSENLSWACGVNIWEYH